ncbi:MAG: PHP domain-containing protein [Rickettsiales bacterium]|nr:MAG: PHP domain-containing protein [Rickettsiales bacterium]
MVDLHNHSVFSDGNYIPADVVEKAYQQGVRVLALTDHDTLQGIPDFLEAAKKFPDLKPIVGCELSANFNEYKENDEIHILALNIKDTTNFDKFIGRTREIRKLLTLERARLMKKKYPQVDIDELLEFNVGTLSNQDIVRYMVDKGIVKDKKELCIPVEGDEDKEISPFKKGGFAHYNGYFLFPSPADTIKAINESGAVSSLAHPYKLKLDDDGLDKYIKKLADLGLQALEVYHSNQTIEQTELYIKIANKYNLSLTGGSDHHGKPEQLQKEYGWTNKKERKIPTEILNSFDF